MVRIRLARYGRKNKPSFRIIVIDSKKKREGKYLEKLGYYNPTEDQSKVVIDKKRYEHWLSVGAQPSEAVVKLVKGKYVFKEYKPGEVKEEPEDNADTQKNEQKQEEQQESVSEKKEQKQE